MLRRRFEADLYKRWRSIKGDVRESVEREDILGLADLHSKSASLRLPSEDEDIGRQRVTLDSPNPSDYTFKTDAQKQAQFRAWLRQQIRQGVLVPAGDEPIRLGQHWTGGYVRPAYSKGVQHAVAELRKQGVDVDESALEDIFNQPIHTSQVELLYIRTYDALEGITTAMDKEISRTLSVAITQGWNPRKAANELNDRVDKVGITRARVLARTEIIRSHAEATLTTYEDQGIETVGVDVEWLTAGDSRVCPICRALEGNVYTIQEARGRLPAHPACRCAWVPRVNDGD